MLAKSDRIEIKGNTDGCFAIPNDGPHWALEFVDFLGDEILTTLLRAIEMS